jgi:sodium-dependent dicarboxylate transporter 2/3/5
LIPVFFTTLRICSVGDAFAPFANPIIILFLGSFVLARAMCVHGLDQRLAYSVLSVKSIATKKTRILFALGLTSMFLSLWISNTATTAMMYPIALGVLDAFRSNNETNKQTPFSVVLLLSLAYSSSIGGIGTPIGSPPNLIAIGLLERLIDYRVTFFPWMIIGFIIMLPMYIVLFFLMRWKLRKSNGEGGKKNVIFSKANQTGSHLSVAQRNVLIAFSVTVFL